MAKPSDRICPVSTLLSLAHNDHNYVILLYTGVFNPPIAGVYLLTVYAMSNIDYGIMYIKNGDVVLCSTLIAQTDPEEVATCTAIAQLAVGDSVRVTGNSGNTATIRGSYSGFAGHIIGDNLSA